MAVHHVGFEVAGAGPQEGFANPQAALLLLPVNRGARGQAGVDEDAVRIGRGQGQARHPADVRARDRLAGRLAGAQPIGLQGGVAAELQPPLHQAALGHGDGLHHQLLVVALQADRLGLSLQVHQQVHHAAAVGPAIHIVAQEHQPGRPAPPVTGDGVERRVQQVEPPVHVADGVGEARRDRRRIRGLEHHHA